MVAILILRETIIVPLNSISDNLSSSVNDRAGPHWILYTTLGCHLCEQAKAVIWQACSAVVFDEVDIADSELLMQRYGCKIPVIARYSIRPASMTVQPDFELSWPFDETQILNLMKKNNV